MKWIFILGFFTSSGFPGSAQEEKDLTSAEVTAKVLHVYSSCDTYRDSCVMRIVDPELNRGKEFKGVAKTAYQRGGLFRFECGAPPKTANREPEISLPDQAVWSDGKHIKLKTDTTWRDASEISNKDGASTNLRSWLAGMGLNTFESSSEIPLLVLSNRDSPATAYFQSKRCTIGKTEMVDNHRCYVMSDSFTAVNGKTNKPMTLSHRYWVDQKSFLIRRVHIEDDYRDGKKKTRILDYHPEINVKLSQEELALDAPKK